MTDGLLTFEGLPTPEECEEEMRLRASLTDAQRLLRPRLSPWVPIEPTDRQSVFLVLDNLEALYGGAAGGGKSVALLADALRYVDTPGYNALLLRRTFPALMKPEALIPLSHSWLQGTSAQWSGDNRRWTFPSGATLSFGYLDTEVDKYQYQGAAYQFIGFDELTQFTSSQYQYLFSRLRRNVEQEDIPVRIRAASNPGGEGHEWVYQRFFVEENAGRCFIPAKLDDNPHLDAEEYRKSLSELPLVERMQLEHGDWTVSQPGEWFKREWFPIVKATDVPGNVRKVRFWDFASTKPHATNRDPDFCVGTLMAEAGGRYWVLDVRRFRKGPAETEAEVVACAVSDGKGVEIHVEQEPGSQSALYIDSLARNALKGFALFGHIASANKRTRAKPLSSASDRKGVSLVEGQWNREWIDELEAFPRKGIHDDQVDSASGAFERLHLVNQSAPRLTEPTRQPPLRSVGM